jgi:probable rRNA maturation factor
VFFGGRELAGDLAISLETAERQARAYGHSLEEEVKVLLLHGVLHLAGMDHETDAGEMAAREGELRERLGLVGGLIGRVSGAKGKGGGRTVRSVKVGERPRGPSTRAARCAQDDNPKKVTAGTRRVVRKRVGK